MYSVSNKYLGIPKSNNHPTNKKPIYKGQIVLHTSITPVLYLKTIYSTHPRNYLALKSTTTPNTQPPKNEVSI